MGYFRKLNDLWFNILGSSLAASMFSFLALLAAGKLREITAYGNWLPALCNIFAWVVLLIVLPILIFRPVLVVSRRDGSGPAILSLVLILAFSAGFLLLFLFLANIPIGWSINF
jgi:Kef-type K+ transport system membrane component KefB